MNQDAYATLYVLALVFSVWGFGGYALYLVRKGQVFLGAANVVFAIAVVGTAIVAKYVYFPPLI